MLSVGKGLRQALRRHLTQAGCPEKGTPGLSPEGRGAKTGRASLRREQQVLRLGLAGDVEWEGSCE